MTEQSLFIFGLGYTSQAVARAAMDRGFSVSGTCRTQEKCDALKKEGIDTFLFDAVPSKALARATHILSSIPPQEEVGDVAIARVSDIGDVNVKWLGYLSTTGVYGDHDGAWVDEQSELRPDNDRLRRRVDAEKQWRECGAHVFRLAGIYGTKRNALKDVLAGKARRIDKKGQFFSRIHVDDIAQTVLASMSNPNPQTVYNVCDDKPAPAHEVVEYACRLLGKEPPPLIPFEEAELSPMGREFYVANRRVKNERIKQELGVSLLFPSYTEGLLSIVRSMNE